MHQFAAIALLALLGCGVASDSESARSVIPKDSRPSIVTVPPVKQHGQAAPAHDVEQENIFTTFSGALLGGYFEDQSGQNRSTYDDFVYRAGKRPVIQLVYHGPVAMEQTMETFGDEALVLLKVPAVLPVPKRQCRLLHCWTEWDDSPTNEALDILIDELADVRGFLGWGWEMNGCWYDWGCKPEAYVRSFRIAAERLRLAGLDIQMAWNPNYADSFWRDVLGIGRSPYEEYFPGADVVDVALLDTYDWDTYGLLQTHDPYVTLKHFAEFAKNYRIPFGVGEFAWCRNRDDVDSGAMAQDVWLRRFFEATEEYGYQAVVYFHVIKEDGDGDAELEDFLAPDDLYKYLDTPYFLGMDEFEDILQ